MIEWEWKRGGKCIFFSPIGKKYAYFFPNWLKKAYNFSIWGKTINQEGGGGKKN